MAYIYDLVDTWNNAAVTFTALKMNVTDDASAGGSLLMDLQVGGASRFRVTKAGATTVSSLLFPGSSSGLVTVQPASAAGTYTLTLPTSAGSNGQALVTDGSGVLSFATVTSPPGGSDTQVQFNDGGVFGGDSGFTWNKTTKTLTVQNQTIEQKAFVISYVFGGI